MLATVLDKDLAGDVSRQQNAGAEEPGDAGLQRVTVDHGGLDFQIDFGSQLLK